MTAAVAPRAGHDATTPSPTRSRAERDALAVAHLYLLGEVARQLSRSGRIRPSAAADVGDYKGAGAVALLVAAERWDPQKGEFPPFARRCIANAMRRLARDSRWRKTCTPRSDRRVVSLHALVGRDPAMSVLDTLADDDAGPGDELVRMAHHKAHSMRVLTVLSLLPAEDRSLLHAYYINDFYLEVTAALLRLTVGQARWRLGGARRRFAEAWLTANPDDPQAAPSSPRSIA